MTRLLLPYLLLMALMFAQASASDAAGTSHASTAKCLGKSATRSGTTGSDVIRGTSSADVIVGLGGNDLISGLGGNDLICGGSGNDQISGNDGNDRLEGGSGDDQVLGNAGRDRLVLSAAPAPLVANLTSGDVTGYGADRVTTVEDVTGSAFDDQLIGTATANRLEGRGGNDILLGLGGVDQLRGGAGDIDLLEGGTGGDKLFGDAGILDVASYLSATSAVIGSLDAGTASGGGGTDVYTGIEGLIGSQAADQLTGNARFNLLGGGGGDDVLRGRGGNDIALFQASTGVTASLSTTQATGEGVDSMAEMEGLMGGSGVDHLIGDAGPNLLFGGDGADTLEGLAGDDTLTGGAGNDSLAGGDGSDDLRGNLGADSINGGGGGWNDTASYVNAAAAVTVSLQAGTASGGDDSDTLVGIESVEGSAFADTLTGNASANTLLGRDGDDTGTGLAGDDYLDGGNGTDSMTGGDGSDVCYAETTDTCEFVNGVTEVAAIARRTAKAPAGGRSVRGLPSNTAAEVSSPVGYSWYPKRQVCASTALGTERYLSLNAPDIYNSLAFNTFSWNPHIYRYNQATAQWTLVAAPVFTRNVAGVSLSIYAPWVTSILTGGYAGDWILSSNPAIHGNRFDINQPAGIYAVVSYVKAPWETNWNFGNDTMTTLHQDSNGVFTSTDWWYCRIY